MSIKTIKSSFLKLFMLVLFSTLTVDVASASRVHIGIFPVFYGPPVHIRHAYYPYPYEYGPPPMRSFVRWIPSHYEYGYFVPGHYIRYYEPMW